MKSNWAGVAILFALTFVSFSSIAIRLAEPVGLPLAVAAAAENCGDGDRNVILTAVGGRKVRINREPAIPLEALAPRLREKLKDRVEKQIFVKADPELSFGAFAGIVDAAQPEVDLISWLLPRTEALVHGGRCLLPYPAPVYQDYRTAAPKPLINNLLAE